MLDDVALAEDSAPTAHVLLTGVEEDELKPPVLNRGATVKTSKVGSTVGEKKMAAHKGTSAQKTSEEVIRVRNLDKSFGLLKHSINSI